MASSADATLSPFPTRNNLIPYPKNSSFIFLKADDLMTKGDKSENTLLDKRGLN